MQAVGRDEEALFAHLGRSWRPPCDHIFLKLLSVFVVIIVLLSSFTFLASIFTDEADPEETVEVPASSAAIITSSFSIDPMAAYVGEVITFTASAESNVGTSINFTIFYDFVLSDGITPNPESPVSVNVTGNPGQIVTEYVYSAPGNISGTYRIRLVIDDGMGTLKNYTRAVEIFENHVPYLSPDLGSSLVAPMDDETFTASLNMSVTCWDVDNDNLTLTWDFGDGTDEFVQTTGPALMGIDCWQNHTWSPDPELWYGVGDSNITYYVNLSLTDGYDHWTNTTTLIRIPLDHNFSPKGNISVNATKVDPADVVTIYGNASDVEGEPLTWTYVFMNETEEVIDIHVFHTGLTEPGERVFQNTTYVFSTIGNYTVELYVSDLADPELQVDPEFAAHNISVGKISMISANNSLPCVSSYINVVDYYTGGQDVIVNETTGMAVAVFSIQAIDMDGEVLNATWDFGDGSEPAYNESLGGVQVYEFVQIHEYYTTGEYNVSVIITDGRPDHEVLRYKLLCVMSDNRSPEIRSLQVILSNSSYGTPGSITQFVLVLYDLERDPIEVQWDFGDGSPVVWTNLTSFDEDGNVTYVMNYTYMEVGTYTMWVNFTDNIYGLGGLHQENYSTLVLILDDDESPVADAGPDQTVEVGTEVIFDGRGSHDDFSIVNYTWTIVELDETLYGIVCSYTFTDLGVYTVELVVNDSSGQTSAPDTAVITVDDLTPPVAYAGLDRNVPIGTEITLDGSLSVDNHEIVNYTWTFTDVDDMTLYGVEVEYTFLTLGRHTVTLTVEDCAGNSDTDTALITVEDDQDPVADAGPDLTVTIGDEVVLDGSGSTDNSGLIENYTWEFEYDGDEVKLYGEIVAFTFDVSGEYVIILTVEDAVGSYDSDTVTVRVNSPPIADAGDDITVDAGDEVDFDGSGSTDDSGLIENYTWTFEYDGAPQELYGVDPTFTFEIVGTYIAVLTVMDAEGETDTDHFVITVEELTPSDSLMAVAGEDQTVIVGEPVAFDGSNSTGDVVHYTWTFEYDGETKTLTGAEPTFVFDIAGTYTVTLTVEDAEGATDEDTVTITVEDKQDGKKSFIESYGLALGITIAVVIVALASFFGLKGRKGGKSPVSMKDEST